MKIIKLTQNKECIVDDKYYNILIQHKWFFIPPNKPNVTGYVGKRENKNSQRRMHRLILELEGYNLDGKQVDHKNGNGLDNRIENLRVATHFENSRNKGLRKDNKSGYKGVIWDKCNKKWRARLRINYKDIHLGYFTNKKEAAIAYNNAAIKYFGEFANLNLV